MLKNRNGFTLVECVFTLILVTMISLLFAQVVNFISSYQQSAKEHAFNAQIDRFIADLEGTNFEFEFVEAKSDTPALQVQLYSNVERKHYLLCTGNPGMILKTEKGGHMPILTGISLEHWEQNENQGQHTLTFVTYRKQRTNLDEFKTKRTIYMDKHEERSN
ncbi:MAG: hypothetical protein LBT37_02105 [Lactobacillaceae bacterium]|jgi:competence protein ComGC|nr:hypothetical protein [Lactobacillaceae bacterium]